MLWAVLFWQEVKTPMFIYGICGKSPQFVACNEWRIQSQLVQVIQRKWILFNSALRMRIWSYRLVRIRVFECSFSHGNWYVVLISEPLTLWWFWKDTTQKWRLHHLFLVMARSWLAVIMEVTLITGVLSTDYHSPSQLVMNHLSTLWTMPTNEPFEPCVYILRELVWSRWGQDAEQGWSVEMIQHYGSGSEISLEIAKSWMETLWQQCEVGLNWFVKYSSPRF